MDYVGERACIYELSRTLKAWERKVEISEVSVAEIGNVIQVQIYYLSVLSGYAR